MAWLIVFLVQIKNVNKFVWWIVTLVMGLEYYTIPLLICESIGERWHYCQGLKLLDLLVVIHLEVLDQLLKTLWNCVEVNGDFWQKNSVTMSWSPVCHLCSFCIAFG